MTMKRIATAALSILFTIARATAAADVVIVSPDGPLPAVVAGDEKTDRDAADDLCGYLSRATGRPITAGPAPSDAQVIIHVGRDAFVVEHVPDLNSLYADGFVLKHVPVAGKDHLILSGARWKSSRWAVEEFLKQFCGVRWLFPYDPVYGEIVPSRPTVTIASGLDQKHEPSYMDRSNMAMYFYDMSKSYLRLRASASNWFGSHEIQFIFTQADYEAHPEWFALFTIPESWAKGIINKAASSASPSVIDALNRGVRRQRWHWTFGSDWQVCTSNPATVQHAAEYARKYFVDNPEAPVVSMGHNDNSGWCECPECVAFANSANPPYTISERYWHWVNQVAKEVAKSNPDKMITTIAYGDPAIPPRFELEKNISVMVTVYQEGHLDLVKRWQKKCRAVNLYSYAYGFFFVGFRHYPHAMRDFLKWGHDELGAVSHVCECSGNWSFDGPKYHYAQALMWNVNADPDQLMDEYCHDWFGAAANPMRAFWDRHEEIYERRGAERRLLFYQWVGFSPSYDEFDRFTLDDVSFLDDAIAKAEQAADTDADRFRVARVADAWKYFRALLLGKLKFADRQGPVLAAAARTLDRALELSRELAALESQKQAYLEQLRAYPHINPHIAGDVYFSTFSRISVFADMRAILDQLCDQVTDHLVASKGSPAAEAFWKQVTPEDPLAKSAVIQLYRLTHADRPNLLVNGSFEDGDLTGWEIGGSIVMAANGAPRTGSFAAEGNGRLSQRIAVKPGECYELTVWGKYPAPPDPDAVLFGVDVSFESGGKAVYPEVTYRRLRSINTAGGWTPLHVTFAAAPNVDTAVIALNPTRSSDLTVIWDDLLLEKISASD